MNSDTTVSLPPPFTLYSEGAIATSPEVKQRFIECFNQTWAGLPADDASVISNATTRIEIQLRDHHHSLVHGPSGDATAQMQCFAGRFYEIIYLSRYAQSLPDRDRRYWIAHELAHVYLHLIDPSHGSSYDLAEEEVARLLSDRWGFGPEADSMLKVAIFFANNGIPLR